MKNKKIGLSFFLIVLTSMTLSCYCQVDQIDTTGLWIATKGELISSFVNGNTAISKVDVSGLEFIFNKKTVKINKTFDRYSPDSIYNYAIMDTVPLNHRFWNKIRIRFFDRSNIVLEMHFLGMHTADKVMWYDIYLKKE